MGFDSISRTHVGHRRKLNEDAVLELGNRQIWAVADGMGGHHAGEVASAMVVEGLARIPDAISFDNLVGKVLGALEDVNRALIALAEADHLERTMGSTVVGLATGEGQYKCFWVGDSRGYRVRAGEIVQLTRDHSLVQDLVDAGMIEASEAETHPNANVITRAVGTTGKLMIDVVGGDLEPGDIFLLASDGLTRLVGAEELLGVLSANPLQVAADHLIDLSLQRGAPDNVSLVIVSAT
jgi:serine/threonine protein phosphatase PrpC